MELMKEPEIVSSEKDLSYDQIVTYLQDRLDSFIIVAFDLEGTPISFRHWSSMRDSMALMQALRDELGRSELPTRVEVTLEED